LKNGVASLAYVPAIHVLPQGEDVDARMRGHDDTAGTPMPLIPFGEYRPDVTDYDQSSTGAVLHALPRGDGYGPCPAFAPYSAALPGPCRGFFKAIKTDGSVAIFAATATRLYQLNATNQTWNHVSKAGGGYSAVSSTDQWQFVQFINFVIAVQANSPPQFFDLTSSTAFADLAGSPPQARYAAAVGSFVVLSGLVNNPYRVQWSALGDAAARSLPCPPSQAKCRVCDERPLSRSGEGRGRRCVPLGRHRRRTRWPQDRGLGLGGLCQPRVPSSGTAGRSGSRT
jgi:hypothetical protein